MKRGVPPTEPNARTGEFTPPGIAALARANAASLPTARMLPVVFPSSAAFTPEPTVRLPRPPSS